MIKVERSVMINAPIEEVFSYVEDPVNQLEWLPGITEVRNIVGRGKGLWFHWTYKMMGILFSGVVEFTEHLLNERLVAVSTGSIDSIWVWTFQPESDKTLLNMVVEYEVPELVLGKMAEWLVLRQNEREADLSMANIKGRLEGYRLQSVLSWNGKGSLINMLQI